MKPLSRYTARLNEMWVFDSSPVELGCGASLTLWGAFLANPFTTTYLQARAYWFLTENPGDEIRWGVAALVCGLLQCSAVLFNKRKARRWLSLTSFMWFLFLTLCFMQTDALPSVGFLIVCTIQSAWTFMRLKR